MSDCTMLRKDHKYYLNSQGVMRYKEESSSDDEYSSNEEEDTTSWQFPIYDGQQALHNNVPVYSAYNIITGSGTNNTTDNPSLGPSNGTSKLSDESSIEDDSDRSSICSYCETNSDPRHFCPCHYSSNTSVSSSDDEECETSPDDEEW